MDIERKDKRRERNGIRYPHSGGDVDILDTEFAIHIWRWCGTDKVAVLEDDLEINCGSGFGTGDFRCLEEIRDGDFFPFQDILFTGRNLNDDEVDIVHSLFVQVYERSNFLSCVKGFNGSHN